MMCLFVRDTKDYPLIVKTPMDLSTICHKLETNEYKDPWEYVDDMQLMFSNAWLYNRRSSPIYKSCTKVVKHFTLVLTFTVTTNLYEGKRIIVKNYKNSPNCCLHFSNWCCCLFQNGLHLALDV